MITGQFSLFTTPFFFISFQTQTHLYLIHLSRRQGRGLGYEAVRHVSKKKNVYVSVTLCCRRCKTITRVMLDMRLRLFSYVFSLILATHDMQSKLVMLFLPESYTYTTVFFWHSRTSKTTTTSDEQKGSSTKERKGKHTSSKEDHDYKEDKDITKKKKEDRKKRRDINCKSVWVWKSARLVMQVFHDPWGLVCTT